MAAQPQPRLTPEQYLEMERASQIKHEYYNGMMYAMPGASWVHVLITSNSSRELGNALRQGPCSVVTSDLRVRVSPSGLYAYPDVVVICDQPRFADGEKDTLLNPLLLIEVLSPSTESHDRGFKSQQYRKLESLQEYALASQSEPRIEVFRRQPGGHWLLTEFAGLEAACRFESVGAVIPLSAIYDKIVFSDEPSQPAPPAG
jgi:Uma2 family endonuclease